VTNQIQIQLRQVSPSTSEATMRSHRVLVDRPVEKGGADAGPMGGELFLAAVGGCFMSNLLAAARARQVAIAEIVTEVCGVIEDSPSRFSALELRIATESVDAETLDRLVEIADRGCIMMNTLRGKLDVRIRTGEARALTA
jgi:putative redox protein